MYRIRDFVGDALNVLISGTLACGTSRTIHTRAIQPGHALLRLVWRSYTCPTTNSQLREAMTEYLCSFVAVAETSGKVCGLSEGDLGPLKSRRKWKDDNNKNNDSRNERNVKQQST